MERMIKSIKKIAFLSLVLGLVISCRDPLDLMAKLEDDVKSANDLYLEIVSITPEENAQGFNPGDAIRIEFDRAIDMVSFEENFSLTDTENIQFESDVLQKKLSYSFNADTNILTIQADPYLDGLIEYKLSLLEGLEGTDGSLLREAFVQNFSTSDAPRGSVSIIQDVTNEGTVDVEITSQGATYYVISNTEAGLASGAWQEITSGKMTISHTIQGTEGTNTVYLKLRDGGVSEAGSATVSNVETATVTYDTTPPVISMPAGGTTFSSTSADAALTAGVSDANTIVSYLWEDADDTGNITFTSESSLSSKARASTDGTYSLKLTATDAAGNSSNQILTYKCDSVAPVITATDTFYTKSKTTFSIPFSADDGSSTESSGVYSYKWEYGGSTGEGKLYISNSSIAAPDFSASTPGIDYYVRLYVYDRAGNRSAAKDFTISCSDTAPSVKIYESVYYINGSETIKAKIDPIDSTILWAPDTGVNGISFSPDNAATTVVTVTGGDGSYAILCTATKGVPTTAKATIVNDETAPIVSLVASFGTNPSNLSATVTEANPYSYLWTKESGPGTLTFGSANSSATSVSASTDGTYTVRFTVTDKSGNTSYDTATFIIDKTAPPAPTVSQPAESTDTTPTFTITPSGGANYFRYLVEGSYWKYTSGTTVSPTLPYGRTPVQFQQRDPAGNWSNTTTRYVVVYPTSSIGISPPNGDPIKGRDLAWYDVYPSYYYRVSMATSLNRTTGLPYWNEGAITRSSPYLDYDQKEFVVSSLYKLYYWKVDVYKRNLLIKGGYEYYTTIPNPKSGVYYFTFTP